jgi:tryptophan 2,3-dioxygenase
MGGYADYIELDCLLSLQRPRTSRVSTELVFIIAHQVYELWFKVIIANLESAIFAVDANDVNGALRALRRVHDIERLMFEQLVLLEHLDPYEFAEIRARLNSASAAESHQFALVEALSTSVLSTDPKVHPARDLWRAFCGLMQRSGLEMPEGPTECATQTRIASVHRIYIHPMTHDGTAGRYNILRELSEAMLDHDEGFALWRYRHCLVAFRQIGYRKGTGGTPGVSYLQCRIDRRFYPDLWNARGRM